MMLGIMAGMDRMGFFKFVDIPFVLQREILMVQAIQQTKEFPQSLYVSGCRRPCCAGRAGYFPVVAQWPFYGPDCSSDLFLPQLQYTMADVPVVQVELFSWCLR